jgi:acetyl-CoA C-acetyltransferase
LCCFSLWRYSRTVGAPPAPYRQSAIPPNLPSAFTGLVLVSDSTTPVILSAVRTPIGRYLGGLSSFTAPQLGAMVIREAVSRAGVEPDAVEEVIMGQVVQGGSGQAPARQALIHAGLPAAIPALTINKVCGSGLKAVMLAAQAIKAGDAECVVAGGQESMSTAPHYVYGMRGGIKAGNQTMVDGMIHDGLWDSFGCCHMGEYAEYTAEKAGVSRQDQDAFSVESHRKAIAAIESGKFKAEILPVPVAGKGGPTSVSTDEAPRKDTTAQTLAKLKPAFRKEGGTVTAGNAPGLNDGASALVVSSLEFAKSNGLAPLARVTAYATAGGEPRDLFFAPVAAVRALMAKAGTRMQDYDLIEANEAFAVQALADGRELGWDWNRVNVHGGAVALGHPIGASGARVLTTLLYALKDRGGRTGLATLCLGGGNAVALSVELV